jgi:hypothetical protein
LPHLYGLKNLKTLNLKLTKATPDGVQRLKEKVPGLSVEM